MNGQLKIYVNLLNELVETAGFRVIDELSNKLEDYFNQKFKEILIAGSPKNTQCLSEFKTKIVEISKSVRTTILVEHFIKVQIKIENSHLDKIYKSKLSKNILLLKELSEKITEVAISSSVYLLTTNNVYLITSQIKEDLRLSKHMLENNPHEKLLANKKLIAQEFVINQEIVSTATLEKILNEVNKLSDKYFEIFEYDSKDRYVYIYDTGIGSLLVKLLIPRGLGMVYEKLWDMICVVCLSEEEIRRKLDVENYKKAMENNIPFDEADKWVEYFTENAMEDFSKAKNINQDIKEFFFGNQERLAKEMGKACNQGILQQIELRGPRIPKK